MLLELASFPHPRWEEHSEEEEKQEQRFSLLKNTFGFSGMKTIKARIMSDCNSSRVTLSCAAETSPKFQDLLKFVEECGVKLEEETSNFHVT